jgi:Tol biopolymer transport system component
MRRKIFLLILLAFGIFVNKTEAQYFNGPNKPDYKVFNYKVYTTPHFEIYHYFENDSVVKSIALTAEKWYERHQMLFRDTFKERNPIIVYANHADFQQTNAISGVIGVGTGGVTESLKNRVVIPVMESAAQTDHVLGHELVHAFQYHFLLSEDTTQMRNVRNIPLWMVEGMAEYLSIGSIDPHTAMWMRDAIINNDFPTLEDMTTSYKYFPYRYGQAFWAFVTGIYGDSIVKPIFDLTAKIGYDKALDSITHFNEKAFSNAWKMQMKAYYYKLLPDTTEKPVGNKILSRKNAGAMNIAPSLSPDGKYIAFLSEKDLFTFDLYLADVKKGKIVKRLSSTIRENRIDDFNYLESGGSWSPDGKKFVFVAFSKGRNRLLIIDIKHPGKTIEVDIPGIDAFSNPTWSPDGEKIVVTGLKEGVTDLYSFNLQTNEVKNLTDDSFCNLMPSWSPDGKYIVYSSDQNPIDSVPERVEKGYFLYLYNIETGLKKGIPLFPGCSNLNAHFSADGKSIFFVSDANGVRNIYQYLIDSSKVYRLTNVITGISGVTEFTPSISTSRTDNIIVYTHYYKGDYNIYHANINDFEKVEVNPAETNFDLAKLPPARRKKDIVNINLANYNKPIQVTIDSFKVVPYKSKFQLDYIGGSNMGVAVSSYYGTGMAGSVDMLFSDIVGNYQLYSSLSINGQVQDFGGSVAFLNNKNKIDWGVSLSHIPYKYGSYGYSVDSIKGNLYNVLNIDMQWIFEDAVTFFAIKPISQTQRLEASSSFAYYSYYIEREKYLVDDLGYTTYIGRIKNLPKPDGFAISTIGIGYTLDNAYYGIASPLRGQRLHLEVDQYAGKYNFTNVVIDFRKYFFFNPLSLAVRLYHQGRYGNITDENSVTSLYIGWPWLVRGFYNFVGASSSLEDQAQLFGSRIGVANIELRIPFTGPERLCLIPFKYFVSELSFFTDAGIAWNKGNELTFNTHANERLKLNYQNLVSSNPNSIYNIDMAHYRYPMVTYGVSLRINLFGYMILEPYYAIPYLTNGKKYAGINLNILPGW